MTKKENRDSRLFDVSRRSSKISKLINRIKGYKKKEMDESLDSDSRWENLKTKLSEKGDFQPAEDSEIQSVEEKLGEQFDPSDD